MVSLRLSTVRLKDKEHAKNFKYDDPKLLLSVFMLIFTWYPLPLAPPTQYAEQGLCNCWGSVRLSVSPSIPEFGRRTRVCCCGSGGQGIDRLLLGRSLATAAPQPGAQQQMRVLPRCQLTQEAEHRHGKLV